MTENVLPSLNDTRRLIANLRRSGKTYQQIGEQLGVNKGIAWKLATDPGYSPRTGTLHKLGITKEPPRHRLVTQVPEDWKLAVQEAAAAEGETVSEWLRRVLSEELFPEEHIGR